MSNSTIKMTTGWKILNSLWVLVTFVPLGLVAYIGFFFIGIRANNRKWLVTGFIYLILIMGSFVMTGTFDTEHIMSNIGVGILLTAWFSYMIHSFAVRQQYLNIVFRRKVHYEHGLNTQVSKQVVDVSEMKEQQAKQTQLQNKKVENKEKQQKLTPPQVININKATEEEISTLPSIHPFLAKNIVKAREKVNQFESIEHLATVVNIKPHILNKSKPYIIFADEKVSSQKAQHKRESEKEKVRKSGRMVDY